MIPGETHITMTLAAKMGQSAGDISHRWIHGATIDGSPPSHRLYIQSPQAPENDQVLLAS